MPRLPTLFVSHGAPNLVLHNSEAKRFLAGFAADLPRPKAILVASAHFDTPAPAATADARPETVHDFRGFEPELYRMTYPAPGAPDLAERATQLLAEAGFAAQPLAGHGYDHGTWVPLKLLYPEADIPVVQLSIQSRQGPEHHLKVGEALRPHLRRARFRAARRPYLPNRLGSPFPSASHDEYVTMLADHVHTPVLWRRSIDHIVAAHPDAVLVEVGPRQVLFNLLDRKWVKSPRYCTDSREDAPAHLAGVIKALRAHSSLSAPVPLPETGSIISTGSHEVHEWPTA